jgi:hypothetical protein
LMWRSSVPWWRHGVGHNKGKEQRWSIAEPWSRGGVQVRRALDFVRRRKQKHYLL